MSIPVAGTSLSFSETYFLPGMILLTFTDIWKFGTVATLACQSVHVAVDTSYPSNLPNNELDLQDHQQAQYVKVDWLVYGGTT